MSHGADSLKSILYALGANLAISVAKLVAAVITGSGSMMAESIHSLADSGNQGLLLLGMKKAKRPPSPAHPLGYSKTIYFWSFIVAIMLFSVGGMFSLYEGWHKLHDPQPLNMPWVAVGVLIFAFIAEGLSLLGCVREVNKVRGDRSLWQWFRESRQSELLVIFGEDLAALLGLGFALMAVLLTIITNDPFYDALGSMFIGGLLVVVAVIIAREVMELIIGQGVEKSEREAMIGFLEEKPEIERVLNLLTLQMGNDVMVAVKAKMVDPGSAALLIENINQCEKAFKARFSSVAWLFFEPDDKD